MSSSFKPTFDSSTLYFANQSLKWLSNPPEGVDFEKMFSKIRDNNIWEKSKETDTLYNKLNQMFILENGGKFDSSGKINMDSYDSGRGSNGHFLMQMIFGLMCLSKVIESIVLGEEINYLVHPGAKRLKPLDEIADCIISPEHLDLWNTVELNDKEKLEYIEWSNEISDDSELNSRIEEINTILFSKPYMSFGATLFDISNGIPHLLTIESTPPSNKLTYAISPEKLKQLPTSMFAHTEADLVSIGRTNGYLVNGLFYQYIANLKSIDYIVNEYRSPLLEILSHTNDINDKDRILEIIDYIADETKSIEDKKEWSFEESIDITNLIFAAVVSNSKSANEIIDEAYKMRTELTPLRAKIMKNGFTEEIKKEIEYLLGYKKEQKKGREFKTKYFNIPLQGPLLDFLQKPLYFGKKKHMAFISMLVDKYEAMIALTDILSKFCTSNNDRSRPAMKPALSSKKHKPELLS